ncbi:hypothetical protein ABPG77_008020 [Micractinium sp. CCAP 211/92]
MPGSSPGHAGGFGTWRLGWENRRAARDQMCACCALTIHLFHFSAYAGTLSAAHIATLLALSAVNLASILLFSLRHEWYLRLRPGFNLAVRLGMLTLSALAFGIATRNVDAICATPLMQHERVQGLFAGLSRLVQMALLLLVGFPLPAAVHVDRGSPVGCRTAVLFLQLVIGVALPTAIYLAFESEEAARLAADQPQGECEHSRDHRLLLWLHSKKKHLCPWALLLGTLVVLGASWKLASML